MTKIELIEHVEKYITIQFRGKIYSYNKAARQFEATGSIRMSLDYALTHAEEIKPGWESEDKWKASADKSIDRDYGVIATINNGTVIDLKTEAHL